LWLREVAVAAAPDIIVEVVVLVGLELVLDFQ
jgi:hypothetical protein